VDRSRPKKPNSPWADVGDAAAYLLGWLRPGARAETAARPPYQAQGATTTAHRLPIRSPRGPYPGGRLPEGGRVIRSTNNQF